MPQSCAPAKTPASAARTITSEHPDPKVHPPRRDLLLLVQSGAPSDRRVAGRDCLS